MRCEAGDVAYVIRSACGNEGKVVQVLYWVEERAFYNGGIPNRQAGWVVEGYLNSRINPTGDIGGTSQGVLPDEWSQPIRYKEGDDETIVLAGKPKEDLLDQCNRLIATFNKLASYAKEFKK